MQSLDTVAVAEYQDYFRKAIYCIGYEKGIYRVCQISDSFVFSW
jgi:hypothetical protein